VPYDKRNVATLAYVGSLVGLTDEVDKSTLSRSDYVRVKIMAGDVSKVSAVAGDTIKPYMYDFQYEREEELEHNEPEIPIQVDVGKQTESHHAPMMNLEIGQSSGQNNLQMEIYTGATKVSGDGLVGELVSYLPKNSHLSKSAPPKGKVKGKGLVSEMDPQLSCKISMEDDGLFNSDEERVQGLSGNNLESKEDVSKEGQGSQIGPNKCQNISRCTVIPEEEGHDGGWLYLRW
jgi:hypothetical protein